jgi:hypothetical protein
VREPLESLGDPALCRLAVLVGARGAASLHARSPRLIEWLEGASVRELHRRRGDAVEPPADLPLGDWSADEILTSAAVAWQMSSAARNYAYERYDAHSEEDTAALKEIAVCFDVIAEAFRQQAAVNGIWQEAAKTSH